MAEAAAVPTAPSDAELLQALARALAESGAAAPRRLRRQPSRYRTSFPLERLSVQLDDGEELSLAFKRLDWDVLDEVARLAKPSFLHDPRREPAVYGDLLAPAGLTVPRYYGGLADEDGERHWLFLEWVEGRELYQVGELGLWAAAAAWLAETHATLGRRVDAGAIAAPLIEHDAGFYRGWMQRALGFAREGEAAARSLSGLEWLAARHDAVVEALLAMPRTIVHGEFYASNVLVVGDVEPVRIAPLDWELAGLGTGLTDLAALVSGGWSEAERGEIVAGYRRAAAAPAFSEADLRLARLQVAIQWLGWAPPEWVPPRGQRHDWLAEATSLAEELQL